MSAKKLFTGIAIILALSVPFNLFAQTTDTPPPDYFADEGNGGNSIGGKIGFKTYKDKDGISTNYFILYVQPEFALGKIGVGFNIPLELSSTNGKIRKKLFDEPSDIASMIRYLRYGQKHDSLYARLGALDKASVGHATIMNNYYSDIDVDTNKVGLQFDMDLEYMGFETVTNNIVKAQVFGGRFYVRPTKFFMEDSIFNRLALGVSGFTDVDAPSSLIDNNANGITDLDSNDRLKYESDMLRIYNVDVEFPLINWTIFYLTPYADLVKIQDAGEGRHYGVMFGSAIAIINSKLDFKFEYRDLKDKYIPSYFDSFYEVERMQYPVGSTTTKLQDLPNEKAKTGWYSEIDYTLLNFFKLGGAFEDYEGQDNSQIKIYTKITGMPLIKVQAKYEKKYFDRFNDIVTLDDKSLLIAEGAYPLNQFIDISVTFTRSWVLNETTGKYDAIDSFSEGIKFSYKF